MTGSRGKVVKSTENILIIETNPPSNEHVLDALKYGIDYEVGNAEFYRREILGRWVE
jgi:hypothetical protein